MTKSTSIVEYMGKEAVKGNIQETLGQKTPQFIASVASLVNSNPLIAECEQKSILSSCLVAASLDLPINQNLGFAYIIPYKNRNKGITEAQFQMGYKGFIQLAMRSGQFQTLNVTVVKEGEIEQEDLLTGEMTFAWIKDRSERDKKSAIGYVAYMRLTNGFTKSLYMTIDEIKKHGNRYSQSMKKGYGLWVDDFDPMAKKTVIKQLITKYAPMKIEMQTAVLADQAVISDGNYQYPDNAPLNPDEVAREVEDARLTKHIQSSTTIEQLEMGGCREAVEAMATDHPIYILFKEKEKELAK